MIKKVELGDLTPYHKRKVMERAAEWRKKNYHRVLTMIRENKTNEVKPEAPTGSRIFDPEQWQVENWYWFTDELCKSIGG